MDWRQEEALWRYGLIREPADARVSGGERGRLVRSLAVRLHAHPSGELRSVGRTTLAGAPAHPHPSRFTPPPRAAAT